MDCEQTYVKNWKKRHKLRGRCKGKAIKGKASTKVKPSRRGDRLEEEKLRQVLAETAKEDGNLFFHTQIFQLSFYTRSLSALADASSLKPNKNEKDDPATEDAICVIPPMSFVAGMAGRPW